VLLLFTCAGGGPQSSARRFAANRFSAICSAPYNRHNVTINAIMMMIKSIDIVVYLVDFILGETMQIVGEAKECAQANEQLGRIVLIPANGVAIILRKLMMKAMITYDMKQTIKTLQSNQKIIATDLRPTSAAQ
jgi:hypothetical protein